MTLSMSFTSPLLYQFVSPMISAPQMLVLSKIIIGSLRACRVADCGYMSVISQCCVCERGESADVLTALRRVLELSGKPVPRSAISHLLSLEVGQALWRQTALPPNKQNPESDAWPPWYSQQVSTAKSPRRGKRAWGHMRGT